jgi:hypothetical protein
MSERQVRIRKAVPVRKAPAQGSFATLLVAQPAMVPRAPVIVEESYRAVLSTWPLRWRERWGRRANALEDQGLDWRAAEKLAYTEVGEERRRRTQIKRNAMPAVGSN